MKKFFSFASLSEKFIRLAERMPVSILLVGGLAALAIIDVNKCCEVSYRWWVFCPVGLFISVAAALWLEDHVKNGWLRHGATLIGVALWGVYCLLLPQDSALLHFADGLQVAVLGAAFFFANFFIAFLAKNKDRAYCRFSAEALLQMLIAGCFGGLLFGGLCLAAFSIATLFNVDMDDKVYGNLYILCHLLFAPLYFLANIPGQKEKHESEIRLSKVLKIAGLYILTPLLAIYAAILYAYLLRIVILWELPNGWVSWLVSALALGGLAVVTMVYPLQIAENRVARWLSRYSGAVILPLLMLMTVGIGRRISDYGISINRCYILLLNIWFYGIYIYLFATKAKHIKWILISPVVAVLLASVGPWKFSSIVKRSLLNKVETIFAGRQLTLSDSASWLDELDKDRRIELREALGYLADTYGKSSVQAFFKDSVEDQNMLDIFAELKLNELKTEKVQIFSSYSDSTALVNITDYQFWIMLSLSKERQKEDENIEIKQDPTQLNIRIIPQNRSVSFPIRDLALQHISHPDKPEAPIFLEAVDNADASNEAPTRRYLLVITALFGEYYPESDSLSINNLSGSLFYK